MAQMLTANRLKDGAVLYWRGEAWVESLGEGDVFAGQAAADAALAKALAFIAGNEVVNPYLFDVRDGKPVKEREIIRAAGPSVREDLGKQSTSNPPLEGGSKNPKDFSGRGQAPRPSPKSASQISTLPQGEGSSSYGEPDVSI